METVYQVAKIGNTLVYPGCPGSVTRLLRWGQRQPAI